MKLSNRLIKECNNRNNIFAIKRETANISEDHMPHYDYIHFTNTSNPENFEKEAPTKILFLFF